MLVKDQLHTIQPESLGDGRAQRRQQVPRRATGGQSQMSYRKSLGDWGEDHARQFENAKFTDIIPLNVGRQHWGGDVMATKDACRYFFQLKPEVDFGKT